MAHIHFICFAPNEKNLSYFLRAHILISSIISFRFFFYAKKSKTNECWVKKENIVKDENDLSFEGKPNFLIENVVETRLNGEKLTTNSMDNEQNERKYWKKILRNFHHFSIETLQFADNLIETMNFVEKS